MNLDFKNINVLLIGDFMIDHYVFGFSNRNSPEAPIPVVLTEKLESIPGGSANVAMNLSALGAKVNCVGCVGDDIWGKKLVNKLDNQGINTDGIEIIKNYKTTLKERIFSLWFTPNRCSSSIINKPRFDIWTSLDNSRCVPIKTST